MGQEIQRLTALAVTRASKPGLYADGAGLYAVGSKSSSIGQKFGAIDLAKTLPGGAAKWDDYLMGVFPISSKRLIY